MSSDYNQKGLLPWNHEHAHQISQQFARYYDYDMRYFAYCGPTAALKSLSVNLTATTPLIDETCRYVTPRLSFTSTCTVGV